LSRRWDVVGAPPQHELFVAELGPDRRLVLALQRAVVPFVQPPTAPHRQPVQVGGVQRQLGGPDRAAQQRGVQHGRFDAVLGQQLPAAPGLRLAGLGQVHVHPAGEQVLQVPVALAVPEQDQGGGGFSHAVNPAIRVQRSSIHTPWPTPSTRPSAP
jgi:hypothetical protein